MYLQLNNYLLHYPFTTAFASLSVFKDIFVAIKDIGVVLFTLLLIMMNVLVYCVSWLVIGISFMRPYLLFIPLLFVMARALHYCHLLRAFNSPTCII